MNDSIWSKALGAFLTTLVLFAVVSLLSWIKKTVKKQSQIKYSKNTKHNLKASAFPENTKERLNEPTSREVATSGHISMQDLGTVNTNSEITSFQANAPTISFCYKCGARLAEGSSFCPKCGKKVPKI